MQRRCVSLIVGLACAIAASAAHAVPRTYTFTGRLVENGVPAQGLHDFQIDLFAARTGGIAIWTETHAAVSVVDGMSFLELGSIDAAGNPLDETILTGEELWIEVSVDGQALSPRTPFRSVPYALRAAIADNVGSLAPADLITGVAAGSGLVGGGSTGDVSLSVDFAGSGSATTVSRADHDHDVTYLSLGSILACGGSDKVTGIDATSGNVVCGTDVDTTNLYTAGEGLTLSPGGEFAVGFTAPGGDNGTATTVARGDHLHDARYPVSAGVAGGQTIVGGTGASDNLTLQGPNAVIVSGRLGVGTVSPAADVDVGSIRFGGRTFDRVTQCSFSGAASGGPSNFYRYWTAANCDNGLPAGSCVGFLSVGEQCGQDEDWKVLLPGETGPGGVAPSGGMAWWTAAACSNPVIRAVYFCDAP